MGGGGSKGGGGSNETESSRTMSTLAKQLFAETTPGRKELESQGLEALKTGGTSASIPSIQRVIESSKAALGSSLKQIDSNMAQTGLEGTPYAASVRADTLLKGGLATNQAANAIGQWFMQMFPSLITGTQQTGSGLLSGAAQSEAQVASANTAAATSKGNSQLAFLGKGLFG